MKRWLVTAKDRSFLVYSETANEAFDVVWRFCAEQKCPLPQAGPKVVQYAGTWNFTANEPVEDPTLPKYEVFEGRAAPGA